jgi:predicted phage tail protein
VYAVAPGDYRFFLYFNPYSHTTTSFLYDATFYFNFEILTPEVEDHTVLYADETVSFNNNPANVLLDYMRNPRYGKGLDNDAFDWITFRKAALQCNQTVNYTDVTTGKAFTCDSVVQTENSIMNNCKLLLVGFRGIMPYTQGKFKLKIENAGDDNDIEAIPSDPPVAFTATADNIIGGLQLVGDNKESKFNRCRITYVDPSADYQPNEAIYPEDGSADDILFLSQDNNQRFETSVSLPTVANREQALQYAEVFVKRSRNAKQIQFATNIAGSNIAVGDLCRVVSENIGLDGVFRITDIRLNSEGDIQITGFEHQPEIYTINAKSADITRPSINLPNPLSVPAPTALVLLSSGQSLTGTDNQTGYVGSTEKIHRIKASWTATTDPFFDQYIVQFKKTADTDYITAGVTSDTFFFISPVAAGESYDVRVASENELARRSAWLTDTGHTVSA